MSAVEVDGAVEDARTYLAGDIPSQREAERLAGEESDGRVLMPGDAEWRPGGGSLTAREAWCRADAEKTRLESKLKLVMGTAAELKGVATWRTHATTRLDEAALKAAEPEVWRTFRRESRVRRFLPQ